MRIPGVVVATLMAVGQVHAQNDGTGARPAQGTKAKTPGGSPENVDRVRARFRGGARAGGTKVDQSHAEAITLTLSAVAVRPVQTWIRAAGAIDKSGKVLDALLTGPDAAHVRPGQRVRAFPPSSRSSMYQAFVTRVVPRAGGTAVEASLASTGRPDTALYVMEIVVEHPPSLSVPNEAIIEEGDTHVVYVQDASGQFVPHEIRTGIQGELYTQILDGVKDGDQVVTFGSFFIDAEQKLKATAQPAQSQPRR
jgi:hypothetical protein